MTTTPEPDFGNIDPEQLAAIRETYAPRQGFCPDDADDMPNSPGWWHAKNRAYAERNIPARYAAATTDRTDIHAWVLAMLRSPKDVPSLLLTGPVGTGKTYAAYAALRLVGESYCPIEWIGATTATLLGDLRPSAKRDSEATMNAYLRTALLFLDDLGAAKSSEWVEEVIYRIVDHRYMNCLPTIFATNVPPGELAERLGDRTASRLAGMCQIVAIKGADRRRAA